MTASSGRPLRKELFRSLLKDPVIRISMVVYLGVILLYLTRPFDPDVWPYIVESYLRLPMQVLVLGAILWGLKRGAEGRESRFWRMWAFATGIWIAIQLVYAFPPPLDAGMLALGIESAVAAFYLCILYALSLHPELDGVKRTDLVSRSFEDVAISILVFVLVIYFAVLPFTLKPEVYDSWAPSLTLYVVLDTIVLVRLVSLVRRAASPRWVALYTGLAITGALWTVTDVFSLLLNEGFAPSVRWGTGATDWPWFLPFAALIVTARMKNLPFPVAKALPQRAPAVARVRRWSGVLVGSAVGLPIIHLALDLSGGMEPDLRGPRDFLVFIAAFVLGAIALYYQSILEGTNRRLEEEKGVRDEERVAQQLAATKLRERQRAAQARAEGQTVQRLGIMAGGIAQDFDKLLTVILDNTHQCFQEAEGSPELTEALTRIQEVAIEGGRLTNQLTAYSGRAHVDVQTIDLNGLVLRVAEQVESKVEGASFRFELSSRLGHLHGDASQLSRVVENLLMKALEGHEPGSGDITVQTGARYLERAFPAGTLRGRKLPPGHYLVLQILNPERVVPTPETSPEATTATDEDDAAWTSLLSVLRSHGGSIDVESTSNHGTTLTMMLPIMESRAAAPADPVVEALSQTGTVLIVDPESSVRRMLRATLVRSGFSVLTAADESEGVKIFNERVTEIAAVLLDADMPNHAAATVLREMHEVNAEVPVLLMSGSDNGGLEGVGDKMSAGLLRRPFHPEAAVHRLRGVLSA